MANWSQEDHLPAGWFTPGDIEFYRDIYRHLVPPNGVTAEVGVYRGRSLMSVADVILDKNIHVYCVDMFDAFGVDAESNRLGLFIERAADFGVRDQLNIMKGTSLERSRDVADGSLDFVFIDADHRYEAVASDIAAWLPKLVRGGWLGGHDYDQEDVRRAVTDVFNTVSPRLTGSSIWLTRVLERHLCASA